MRFVAIIRPQRLNLKYKCYITYEVSLNNRQRKGNNNNMYGRENNRFRSPNIAHLIETDTKLLKECSSIFKLYE